MTDELVKRLRSANDESFVETLCGEAADRIEQLTAERDRLGRELNVAKYGQPDFAWSVHLAAMAEVQAERDRLREALEGLLTLVEHANFEEGWCCCGDDMLHHQNPMDCGHTPVDMGEYHASLAIKEARAALKGETP